MGHLVCPEEDADGITWSTDRGDKRGGGEERESGEREYDINVWEMKERKKWREEQRES